MGIISRIGLRFVKQKLSRFSLMTMKQLDTPWKCPCKLTLHILMPHLLKTWFATSTATFLQYHFENYIENQLSIPFHSIPHREHAILSLLSSPHPNRGRHYWFLLYHTVIGYTSNYDSICMIGGKERPGKRADDKTKGYELAYGPASLS
jgi:hypothetical protein